MKGSVEKEMHDIEVVPKTPKGEALKVEKSVGLKSYKGILVGNEPNKNASWSSEGIEVEGSENDLDPHQEDFDKDDKMVDPCPMVQVTKEEHENYCKVMA